MNKPTQSFTSYWRNSLADADIAKGAWRDRDKADYSLLDVDSIKSGVVPESITKNLFNGVDADIPQIYVVIYPFIFRSKTEHAARQSITPGIIGPVIAKALLNREGGLTPAPNGQPVMARDLLDPLDAMDQLSFTIASMDDLDGFISKDP
jgi:hypothetical protein